MRAKTPWKDLVNKNSSFADFVNFPPNTYARTQQFLPPLWPAIRPPTTYPRSHRPPTQRLAESWIIFERHDNRNIFILQNLKTVGKTYNYTLVYYPKRLLVPIKHIRRSQLYLFPSFRTLMLYSSPDISKFISTHGFFFGSQCEYYIVSWGDWLTKAVVYSKGLTFSKCRSFIFWS